MLIWAGSRSNSSATSTTFNFCSELAEHRRLACSWMLLEQTAVAPTLWLHTFMLLKLKCKADVTVLAQVQG